MTNLSVSFPFKSDSKTLLDHAFWTEVRFYRGHHTPIAIETKTTIRAYGTLIAHEVYPNLTGRVTILTNEGRSLSYDKDVVKYILVANYNDPKTNPFTESQCAMRPYFDKFLTPDFSQNHPFSKEEFFKERSIYYKTLIEEVQSFSAFYPAALIARYVNLGAPFSSVLNGFKPAVYNCLMTINPRILLDELIDEESFETARLSLFVQTSSERFQTSAYQMGVKLNLADN